ncbi:hypothetical protein D9M71_378770 [compost metagenome]
MGGQQYVQRGFAGNDHFSAFGDQASRRTAKTFDQFSGIGEACQHIGKAKADMSHFRQPPGEAMARSVFSHLLSQLVNEHQNSERTPEHARGQHRRFAIAHHRNIQQAARFPEGRLWQGADGVDVEPLMLGIDACRHELKAMQILQGRILDVVSRIVVAVSARTHPMQMDLGVRPGHPAKMRTQGLVVSAQVIQDSETLMPDTNAHACPHSRARYSEHQPCGQITRHHGEFR